MRDDGLSPPWPQMQSISIPNPISNTNPILRSSNLNHGYGDPWLWQADPVSQMPDC